MSAGEGSGEVRLDPDSIEALARRLAELIAPREEEGSPRPRERLTAEEVSRWCGVSRRWVYDNAAALGAQRLGAGPRPRLRFDPELVAERLGELGAQGDARRSGPIGGDCREDSLSRRSRGNVVSQAKKRPGRRGNAPRPGAEGGPSAR